jgi:hypothetical protein
MVACSALSDILKEDFSRLNGDGLNRSIDPALRQARPDWKQVKSLATIKAAGYH